MRCATRSGVDGKATQRYYEVLPSAFVKTDPVRPPDERPGGPLRVCLVARSLDTGGAERQLVELVRGMPPADFDWTILTFYEGGALETEVKGLPNARIRSLGKQGRWDTAGFLMRLMREVRRADPHVLQGCLGVANEAALLAGRLLGRPVLWRMGASNVDFSMYDWALGAIFKAGALLSRFPDCIVVNSCAGYAFHAEHGWSTRRMTVIPNGFELERFRRDPAAGRLLRRAWGVPDDAVLVGLTARLDPIKDHFTFLAAAAALRERQPAMRFVCVGDGPSTYREALLQRATALGLDARLIWAGECSDMVAAYSSLDLGCRTSLSEGLPNSVGEAMSCEVPCVVTDAGDSAAVVGDTGIVVPPRTPAAVADALDRLGSQSPQARQEMGRLARRRIEARYSRARYIEAMTSLLASAASARVSPSHFAATRERLRTAACG